LTTDIATKGGQFDLLTIGTYDGADLAKKGVLVYPSTNLAPTYDVGRSTAPIRAGLPVAVTNKLDAAPVLRRSSMICLARDLFEKAGSSDCRRSRPGIS